MGPDEFEIRRLIDRWSVSRDAAMWDDLADVWHESGRMHATWFDGAAVDFVAASRAGYEKGVNVTHTLGGTSMSVRGSRAVAQTRMSITQRCDLARQEVDVICTGRFYDLFVRDDERWHLLDRSGIYENDRIVPVAPGERLDLDVEVLSRFPAGYRHLAYAQTRAGLSVNTDLPGLRGPALDALLIRGRDWLADA